MRNRTRVTGPVYGTTNFVNSSGTTYHTITTVNLQETETMSDVVTPGFRTKIKKGQVVNNPCSYTKDSLSCGGGFAVATQKSNPANGFSVSGGSISRALYTSYGGTWVWGSSSPPDADELVERAKQMAIASIDATPYAFMEDALEITSTLRYLNNPVRALYNLSKKFRKAYKHRRSVKKRTHEEAIADVYLEFQFAFMPLVRSIANGWQLALNPKAERPSRATARGRAEDSSNVTGILNTTRLAGSGSRYQEVQARAQVLYTHSNPVNDWRFQTGFRLKDVPAGLWAIFPYSFMIDRVTNISDSIKGLTNLADPQLMILAGSTTTRRTDQLSWLITEWKDSSYDISVTGDQVKEKIFHYDREPWGPEISDVFHWKGVTQLVKDASSIADLLALTVKNLR